MGKTKLSYLVVLSAVLSLVGGVINVGGLGLGAAFAAVAADDISVASGDSLVYKGSAFSAAELKAQFTLAGTGSGAANEGCAVSAVTVTKKGSANATSATDAGAYKATLTVSGCNSAANNGSVADVEFDVLPFNLSDASLSWGTTPANPRIGDAITVSKPAGVPTLPTYTVALKHESSSAWIGDKAVQSGDHSVGLKFSAASANFTADGSTTVAKDAVVTVIDALAVDKFIANLGADASLYRLVFPDSTSIVYSGDAFMPNAKIQRRASATGSTWSDVTGYTIPGAASVAAATTTAFKTVWADNVAAGRGTLTITGFATGSNTGTCLNDADTVFRGASLSGTFPIKKLTLTSGNIDDYFDINAASGANVKTYNGSAQVATPQIKKSGSIAASEITLVYKEEGKSAAAASTVNAGVYDVYFAVTGTPANFNSTGVTETNAKSASGVKLNSQLIVNQARLFNSEDGATLVPAASAHATATLSGDYFYNNGEPIVIPKANLTVVLKAGAVTVPASEIESIESADTDVEVNTSTGALITNQATAAITLKDNSKNFVVPGAGAADSFLIVKFTIRRGDATKANFTYTAPTSVVYDGTVKTAAVVKNDEAGDLVLSDGSSYPAITVKYNGAAEAKDVGKYYVTAGIPQTRNFNKTDDVLVDSFTVARAPLRNNFAAITNWADIEERLEKTADNPLRSGTAEWPDSLTIEAKGDYAGLGDVTYWFARSKTAGTPVSTVPADTGLWWVGVTVTRGDNIDSVSSRVWFENQLNIGRASIDESAFNLPETRLVYGRNSTYTFNGPTVVSATYGSIDTIHYAITGLGDAPTQTGSLDDGDYKVANVAAKGATFRISVPTGSSVVSVGDFALTAKIFGSRKTSTGAIIDRWETEEIPFIVGIDPRRIDSAGVAVTVNAKAADTVYNGEPRIPSVTLKEGATNLVAETTAGDGDNHYSVNPEDVEDEDFLFNENGLNNVNAGTGYVVVRGNGNYTGLTKVPFPIAKRLISAKLAAGEGYAKRYDGTTHLDTAATREDEAEVNGWVKVTFTGLPTAVDNDDLINLEDYEITAASIDNAQVGARTVSATVKLQNSDRMANFRLASAADATVEAANNTTTVVGSKSGDPKVTVTRLDPTDRIGEVFAFTIPANHYYSGIVYGLKPPPSLKDPLQLGAGTMTTQYVNSAGKVVEPKEEDVYKVQVKLAGTANFVNGTYDLGEYEIKGPAEPVITAGSPRDTTVRKGRTVSVTVAATSPNSGALSYKWRSYASDAVDDTGKAISGATAATYAVGSAEAVGTVKYFSVTVTNTYDGMSVTASSRRFSVTILEAPKPIIGSTVKIDADYADNITYTGAAITLDPAFVTVQLPSAISGTDTLPGAVLVSGVNYELRYTGNINVGTATVSAVGVDAYEGSVSTTFQIKKRTLTAADLTMDGERTYTGDTLSAPVRVAVEGATGIGAITVKYDGSTTVPKNAKTYAVTVDVADGANYSAADALDLGDYTIEKAILDTTWFNFAIPEGHKAGQSAPLGIGEVTLKKGEGATIVGVLYNDVDSVPGTVGTYVVTVDVLGGANFYSATVILGNYSIGSVSVAGVDRVIPTQEVTDVVSVAPVKVVAAASFTAGPSPVSKNGTLKFFSTKQVKGGRLYVFDANGNAVAKLSAKPGIGEIGSWNLTDNKGAAVSEGSYVVKGALVGKDGTREKVAFVFAVVK